MKVITINGYKVEIEVKETDVFGIIKMPQMVSFNNDEDWSIFTKMCHQEVSTQNFDLVDSFCKNYMTDGILEIGVSRNGDGSFTQALLQNKPNEIKYLGVDLNDKSFLNDSEKNIFTLKENSFNQFSVRNYMKKIGMDKISILFIDGWHSLNAVINDWLYTDMLSENGIVIFHDTNYHPGPTVFVEFIDKSIFKVEKYFENQNDYGITIASRLK